MTTSKPLTWKSLCTIASDVAAGILHLHKQDVIHRDIAARNVLIRGKDGDVHGLLCDFGLSRVLDSSSPLSVGYITKGDMLPTDSTAPECFKDGIFSRATDVYAFGIFLNELLTATAPYSDMGLSPGEIRSKVMNGLRPSITDHAPASLTELMQLCWRADIQARPTMDDICNRLRAMVQYDPKLNQEWKLETKSEELEAPSVYDNMYHPL